MQFVIYALIVCLFSVEWLADKLSLLPHVATYYAEGFAALIMVSVILIFAQRRRIDIEPLFAALLAFFICTLLASAISNHVSTGVLIGGIRIHLKFLPFLLLPLVYDFSELQIRRQLLLVLILSLIQAPVALYQRFVKYADTTSGDPVGGTLGANASGILSIWLACAITVVFSFYLVKKIKTGTLLILLALLITPMLINETKISFFLIPLALAVPVVLAGKTILSLGRVIVTTATAAILLVTLVTVYNALRPNKDILDWFTSEDATEYVYQGTTTGGTREDVKRLDAIRIAYEKLSYENALPFGLGPGNISPAFSPQFEGEYFRRYQHFLPKKVQFSLLLWETGLVGTALVVLLITANFGIGFRHRSKGSGSIYQGLAIGWMGVSAILLTSFLYISSLSINLFLVCYWLYSGTLVAYATRSRADARQEAGVLPAAVS